METGGSSRVGGFIQDWRERGSAYEVARLLTAPARKLLVQLDVEGAEHLPDEGPALVAANHLSFFDSILMLFGLPRQVGMLGKAEYTDHVATRWLFCGAGMIPVRRESAADLPQAFEQIRAVLDDGGVVGVFPEGTRSRDGALHRGHSGAAHLALLTGAPLIPAGITGTDEILPSGARLLRPFRKATLRLGQPINAAALGFTKSTNRARRQLTDILMRDIGRLSSQEYVDEFAPIPGH